MATLPSAQPAKHDVGSSHNGAQQAAPNSQTQKNEHVEDVNASQLEDDAPVAAKVLKKRSKLDSKSKGVKRVRDSAGEAGPAAKKASIVTPKRVFYSDLGGIDDVLDEIQKLIERPLMHPEVCAHNFASYITNTYRCADSMVGHALMCTQHTTCPNCWFVVLVCIYLQIDEHFANRCGVNAGICASRSAASTWSAALWASRMWQDGAGQCHRHRVQRAISTNLRTRSRFWNVR